MLQVGVPELPDPIGCVCELMTDGAAGSQGQTDQNSLLQLNTETKPITATAREHLQPPAISLDSKLYSCEEDNTAITCSMLA
jgi:hypothetical protein